MFYSLRPIKQKIIVAYKSISKDRDATPPPYIGEYTALEHSLEQHLFDAQQHLGERISGFIVSETIEKNEKDEEIEQYLKKKDRNLLNMRKARFNPLVDYNSWNKERMPYAYRERWYARTNLMHLNLGDYAGIYTYESGIWNYEFVANKLYNLLREIRSVANISELEQKRFIYKISLLLNDSLKFDQGQDLDIKTEEDFQELLAVAEGVVSEVDALGNQNAGDVEADTVTVIETHQQGSMQ